MSAPISVPPSVSPNAPASATPNAPASTPTVAAPVADVPAAAPAAVPVAAVPVADVPPSAPSAAAADVPSVHTYVVATRASRACTPMPSVVSALIIVAVVVAIFWLCSKLFSAWCGRPPVTAASRRVSVRASAPAPAPSPRRCTTQGSWPPEPEQPAEPLHASDDVDPLVTGQLYADNLRTVYADRGVPGRIGLAEFSSSGGRGDLGVDVGALDGSDAGIPEQWAIPDIPVTWHDADDERADTYGSQGASVYSKGLYALTTPDHLELEN